MNIKSTFTAHAVELHIDVEKWLVRHDEISVGQLKDGRLLVVDEDPRHDAPDFSVFTNFGTFAVYGETADGVGALCFSYALVRDVAHALGITQLEFEGRSYVVDSDWSDEAEEIMINRTQGTDTPRGL